MKPNGPKGEGNWMLSNRHWSMSRFTTLVASALMGQALCAQLSNPGFESGITGWQVTCPSEVSSSSDAAPYGGSSSLRIRCLSSTLPDCYHNDGILPLVYQPLSGAQNGTLLQVNYWTKAEPDQQGDELSVMALMGVGWMTSPTTVEFASGDCAWGSSVGGGSTQWAPGFYSCTIAGIPTGATPVLILGGHAYSNTNGHILFDNVNIALSGTGVQLRAKAWLDGPYDQALGLMRDALRAAGLIPATEPYTALFGDGGGGEAVAPSVLAMTGANAIVDWVRLELHLGPYPDGATTPIAWRNALLQCDGDIVDVDGSSPVTFATGPGNYLVVVRHRNHLPVMNTYAIPLNSTPYPIDFRAAALDCYARPAPNADLPRKTIGTARALWAGNTEPGAIFTRGLYYVGQMNDRDPILAAIGGSTPTATISGYHLTDVNMDGVVKYVGAGNDRDPILLNIGGGTPTNVRKSQVYPY